MTSEEICEQTATHAVATATTAAADAAAAVANAYVFISCSALCEELATSCIYTCDDRRELLSAECISLKRRHTRLLFGPTVGCPPGGPRNAAHIFFHCRHSPLRGEDTIVRVSGAANGPDGFVNTFCMP